MEAKTCDNCRYRGYKDEIEICQDPYLVGAGPYHLIPEERTCGNWEQTEELPIPTVGANVNSLIDWLRDALAEKENGEIGLIFTVHCAQVRKWQKIDVTNALDKNGREDIITETLGKMERGY